MWHRRQNLLTHCKAAGLIHVVQLHFPQEDCITFIPKRTMLSPYPGKSLHQSCHFSTALIPYSITCLLCTDILPGVSPCSSSDRVPVQPAQLPEMSFLPWLGNVKSHILCLSLLLAEQTPVKTKPRSDGRRKTWGEGPVSINKTLLVSSTKDYPGVPHSVIQGVSLPQSKLKVRGTLSSQRCTVICQEFPRPEVILSM